MWRHMQDKLYTPKSLERWHLMRMKLSHLHIPKQQRGNYVLAQDILPWQLALFRLEFTQFSSSMCSYYYAFCMLIVKS